jgi:serine protease Do
MFFKLKIRYLKIKSITVRYFVFIAFIFLFSSCSISRSPEGFPKQIVTKDNPIFDKSFSDLNPEQLQLKNFWKEPDSSLKKEPIILTNSTFAETAELIRNGVVNLYAKKVEEREARFGISPNDLLPFQIPLVSAILDFIPFQVPVPFRTEGLSLGSGFIINSQGYVLTNAHVVSNAIDIRVVLSGEQKEFPGKIIGIDRLTDVALIKIESSQKFEPILFGDSDALRVGEVVLAVGNPLGLRHSVTSGLVSAKERVFPREDNKLLDFIQTDSAINPGNSGGPLINLYGETVGINTAIISKAQNIGFSVPINTVKEIMPLLVLGKTERGWFGAAVEPLTLEKAVKVGYSELGGVLINDVTQDSPAQRAGILKGDAIINLNGEKLKGFFHFRRKLLGLSPGREISVTILRDGEILEVSGKLESAPKLNN